jgi:hypothetical protein
VLFHVARAQADGIWREADRGASTTLAPFIVGADASDTAPLRVRLAAHPRLALVPSTPFRAQFFRDAARGTIRPDAFVAAPSATPGAWDAASVRDAIERAAGASVVDAAEVLRRLYTDHAARWSKSCWGDGTARYVLCMRAIARLLPEARFVHVVADGRDSLARRAARLRVRGGTAEATSHALHWRRCVKEGRAFAGLNDDRYLEVRREDLVADADEVLRRVCAFLELDVEPAWLDSQASDPAPAVALSDDEVAAFEKVAGATLRELGYACSSVGDAGTAHRPGEKDQLAKARFQKGARRERARDWTAALAAFADATRAAPENATYAGRYANLLERTGRFGEAWDELARWARLVSPALPNEWEGQSLAGKRVLVRRRIRHVAAEIRQARFIGCVGREAASCTVLADPRLTALFARTFPAARFVSSREAATDIDCSLGYEDLAALYGRSAEALRAVFVPLVPDRAQVEQLGARYGAAGKKRIGIAWASSNEGKRLPGLEDWRPLLELAQCRFVSLQYGDVAPDLGRLDAMALAPIIVDASVDQLADLDRFAAQIAALDAVVTISCTAAHLAGALGKPTLVLFDEEDEQSWQHESDASPWYPSLRLLRRRAVEPWSAIVKRAVAVIAEETPSER